MTGYLVAAVVLTGRLWTDPAGRVTAGDPNLADADLFAWSLRYAATAVAHGHLPALVTTALNAPRGVNLMWNTTILLPSLLLAPLTLVTGPVVSLTVLLTLSYAGSATSLFVVLRRWNASTAAAALGGAIYGFSPALVNSGISHDDFVIAVTPPLIIDAILRIVTRRGSPARNGAWLGVLVVAQLFTAEELLVDTAVAALIILVVIAARRRVWSEGRAIARSVLTGGVATAAVTLLLGGYGLWVQFRGPLTEHGSPWPAGRFISSLTGLVTAPGTLLFHTTSSAASAASSPTGLWEYLSYIGYPLLIVVVAAAIVFWREVRIRAVAVAWLVLELASIDDGWLRHLPLLSELLPDRLAILADGAAAAVLAFALDRAVSSSRLRPWAWLIALLAMVPLIPLPLATAAVTPVPMGWRQAFAELRLGSDARVLVLPIPYAHYPQAMSWQASTGEPGQLIGGWFIGPGVNGQARSKYFGTPQATSAVLCLDRIWDSGSLAGCPSGTAFAADMRYWDPDAVMAVTGRGSRLARSLDGLLGQPTVATGNVLGWRISARTG